MPGLPWSPTLREIEAVQRISRSSVLQILLKRTTEMSIAQSSEPHTPLANRTRNLRTVVRMSKGSNNSVTVASEVEVAPAMVTPTSFLAHRFEGLEVQVRRAVDEHFYNENDGEYLFRCNRAPSVSRWVGLLLH
jgi:hypothetical protein